MALSTNEATSIQNRFLLIERKLNEIQTALNNLATKAQSRSLLNIRQNEIVEIQETLEQLERVNGAILLDVHEADTDAHASVFAEYYKKGDFIDSTNGIIDAGKPLKLDSDGKLDPSLVELSFEDHSTLSGLDGDDHTQYHTDGRADTWLATKDTDDLSEGTNLYYTEARVSANSDVSANTAVRHSHSNKAQLDLVTDGDHDVRTDVHFIEASIDHGSVSGLNDDDHSQYHNNTRGDARYYLQSQVDIFLAGKSDTGHTHHDLYYTEAEVDTLLSGYSETSHLHDNRYYTESETDSLLSSKSNTSHLHDDRYYTEIEIDTLLTGYTITGHDHDDLYYTDSEVDAFLATKSAVGHNHDGDYYTKAQVDITVTGLAPYYHEHDDQYYEETEVDALLTGKSDVGHSHGDLYYTEVEIDIMLAGYSVTGHNHNDIYYTESETDSLLNGKSDTGHLHDGRYYTESEIDILLSGVNHGDLENLLNDDHTQYLTVGRADAWLSTKTTTDLSEGTNQYYTEGRVSANTDVSANTSARHSHSNKAQLDLVTDGDHDVRSDNPHSVTAAQVGAPTTGDLSTHTGDNTIHFVETSIDHGTISGLADDDHTQYLLADGSRDVTGDLTIVGDLLFSPLTTDDVYIGTGGGNIIFTSPIVTGPLFFDADTGPTVLFDMPVTSTPSAGDEMSVAFAIDSNTIATVYAQADGADGIQAPSFKMGAARFQGSKGDNVASADELILGDGNFFFVTGTTTINHISNEDWQAGSMVVLHFENTATVTHQAGSPAGTEADVILASSSNFTASGGNLSLVYDGEYWRETSRTVI